MTTTGSILTFNMSVKDRQAVVQNTDPFQIMPATRNYMTDNIINSYPQGSNNQIIIHMNYITRVFSSRSYENGSRERQSLRQYAKLADKLGTKNILIHLPETTNEWYNLSLGLSVIHDELLNYTVHLEIPAFSRDFIAHLGLTLENSLDTVDKYIQQIIETINKDNSTRFKFKIVFDTAHLYANGLTSSDMMSIMDKYKEYIEYIHLNGNLNYMLSPDSHTHIFSDKNKMADIETLSNYISNLGVICVAEVTKIGVSFEEWRKYADKYNFRLSTNDMYSH